MTGEGKGTLTKGWEPDLQGLRLVVVVVVVVWGFRQGLVDSRWSSLFSLFLVERKCELIFLLGIGL